MSKHVIVYENTIAYLAQKKRGARDNLNKLILKVVDSDSIKINGFSYFQSKTDALAHIVQNMSGYDISWPVRENKGRPVYQVAWIAHTGRVVHLNYAVHKRKHDRTYLEELVRPESGPTPDYNKDFERRTVKPVMSREGLTHEMLTEEAFEKAYDKWEGAYNPFEYGDEFEALDELNSFIEELVVSNTARFTIEEIFEGYCSLEYRGYPMEFDSPEDHEFTTMSGRRLVNYIYSLEEVWNSDDYTIPAQVLRKFLLGYKEKHFLNLQDLVEEMVTLTEHSILTDYMYSVSKYSFCDYADTCDIFFDHEGNQIHEELDDEAFNAMLKHYNKTPFYRCSETLDLSTVDASFETVV